MLKKITLKPYHKEMIRRFNILPEKERKRVNAEKCSSNGGNKNK